MSWDSYIDNLLAQTKDSAGTQHGDRACIIGLDGGAPWTTAGHSCSLKVMYFYIIYCVSRLFFMFVVIIATVMIRLSIQNPVLKARDSF